MSKGSDEIVYGLKRDYLEKISLQGNRIDGRKPNEYRPIIITPNFALRAEGSADVKLGKTRVLVGVKVEPGEPFPDTPNQGVLTTNAELIPMASPTFEVGPPNEDSIELARVVDRSIRESKMIDLEKMVITPGEKVWIVYVDIHVLDYDGNLIDASQFGAVAALLNTKVPGSRYGLEDFQLPVNHIPVMTTFVKIGKQFFVDPSLEEEEVATARLSIATNEEGHVVAMQKGLTGSFSPEEILEAIDNSIEIGKDIRKRLFGR